VARSAIRCTPLRGQDAILERLRVDRQLEEAMIQGPDPLHLAEVFGLHEKTAMRYADSARALLEQAIETSPPSRPRTHGPNPRIELMDPWVRGEEPSVSANPRGSRPWSPSSDTREQGTRR
jgi:hypothetical protein